ncbi:hypothetical protein [Thalassobacillus devorans]|uniref:hypothetical protein n=1 Tax=Thalassobacillus devorans TaxID=279813 RepID=UPI000A1C848A|nr:hypothetical protein [Thalassobacillus devorans]
MGPLPEFHKLTVQLDELLQAEISSNGRHQQIEEINQLIDQRGSIIHLLDKPVEKEEKVMMEEILTREIRIQEHLEKSFEDLKQEIRMNKKHQTSARKYSNPYDNVSNHDGIFLDQKK